MSRTRFYKKSSRAKFELNWSFYQVKMVKIPNGPSTGRITNANRLEFLTMTYFIQKYVINQDDRIIKVHGRYC